MSGSGRPGTPPRRAPPRLQGQPGQRSPQRSTRRLDNGAPPPRGGPTPGASRGNPPRRGQSPARGPSQRTFDVEADPARRRQSPARNVGGPASRYALDTNSGSGYSSGGIQAGNASSYTSAVNQAGKMNSVAGMDLEEAEELKPKQCTETTWIFGALSVLMGFALCVMAYLYFTEEEEFMQLMGQAPGMAASTTQGAAFVAAVGCMDPASPAFLAEYSVPCSGPNGCHTVMTDDLGCCDPREDTCEQPSGNRCPTQTSMDNDVLSPCNNGCCPEPAPPTCNDIRADGSNVLFDCGAHTHSLTANPESVTCARGTECTVDLCCTVAPPARLTADECPAGILRGKVVLARPMSTYQEFDNCWVYLDLHDGTSEPNGRMDADEPRAQLDDDGLYAIDLVTCDALEFVRDQQNATNAIRLRSSSDSTPCDPIADPSGCKLNLECDEGAMTRPMMDIAAINTRVQRTPTVLSRLTRVAIEVQKVLVGEYSPDYSNDKQKTNYIRSASCNCAAAIGDCNCGPDIGPAQSRCQESLLCSPTTCPTTYSSLGNGAGFSPACMARDVVEIMVGAFGLPMGTDVFTEAWEQDNCGFKCIELHRAEKIMQILIAVASELSSCSDATALTPEYSTYPVANSKRDLAQKFIYGRMGSVIVAHGDRGVPIDLNDVKILEELFLYATPCNVLATQLGEDALSDEECASHWDHGARFNCPAYLTCGQPGTCSTRPIRPALSQIAALNRAVHNANMNDEGELDRLDNDLEDLLDRIRRDGDECSTSPCAPNGICEDGLAEYFCVCNAGFSGPTCFESSTPVSEVDGFVDYYGSQPIDCILYSQYEIWVETNGARVWDDGTSRDRTLSGYVQRTKYTVGPVDDDGQWPYDFTMDSAQPESVIVSEPRAEDSVCPLVVTRADKTSANRLTTLTEFLKLEEDREHEDAIGAIRRSFHLDRGIDYYDHLALYQDADCEQTRNIFRAFLKLDLLIESAVHLSTEPLAAETQAYYEIADLTSDGELDLTGNNGVNSIISILINSGVPRDSATVAAEYLVQKCRQIDSTDACNPAKVAQSVDSRDSVMAFFDEWKDDTRPQPCDENPCENGATCTNVIKDETLVYRCDCVGDFVGRRCDEEAVVLEPQGRFYTIHGSAYDDDKPYEGCEVYLDLNNNGALDSGTELSFVRTTGYGRGDYRIEVDPSIQLRADAVVRMRPEGDASDPAERKRKLCPPLATRADACAMTSMTTIALLVDEFGAAEGRSLARSQEALNDVLNLDDGADVYGMWKHDRNGNPVETTCDRKDCTEHACGVQESFCTADASCGSLCSQMLRVGLQFTILYQFVAEVSQPEPLAKSLPALLTEVAAAANERQLDLDDPYQVYDLLARVVASQGCRDQPGAEPVQCSATRLAVIARYAAGQSRDAERARLSSVEQCNTHHEAILRAVETYQRDTDFCVVGLPFGTQRHPCEGVCEDVISTDPYEYNCLCGVGQTGDNCADSIQQECTETIVTDCVVTNPVTGTIFGMGCSDPGGAIEEPSSVSCTTSAYSGCRVFADLNGNGFHDYTEPYGDVGADNTYTIILSHNNEALEAQHDTNIYVKEPFDVNTQQGVGGPCSQRLITQAAGSQMNALTTLVAVQPSAARDVASRFRIAPDYSVFTAPVGQCTFDTSDDCMRVEVAAMQLDVLVAGALSQRSPLWNGREDTEAKLYDYMSNLAGSSGYWLTKPEGVQDILMSIGARSDSAFAIGNELAEWNLQLTARQPQNADDYGSYTAEARGLNQQQAVNTYFFNDDACEESPCQNGAECVDLAASNEYNCLCVPGFTGSQCEVETVTPQGSFYGYAFGPYGPYQGCQVFIDLNSNRLWDADEPKVTTGSDTVAGTEGKFEFQNLGTNVAPLMRVLMIASTAVAAGEVTASVDVTRMNECPYLETVVPLASELTADVWTSSGQSELGSSSNPIAMSDLTTLQLYRTTRNPPGDPLETVGIGSTVSFPIDWQTQVLMGLNIDPGMKPFEIRCNFIKAQGSTTLANRADTCQGERGEEVFNALLAMHTVYRVGMAQKVAWLSPTAAKIYMIDKLAQELPAWYSRPSSILGTPIDSTTVYQAIWSNIEQPFNVLVRGVVMLEGTPVERERTMTYRCDIRQASEVLAVMLSGAPTRNQWMFGDGSNGLAAPTDYYYAAIGHFAQSFVDERNQLEGNAAQCCRARNCFEGIFEEQCFLTNDALPQASCEAGSTPGCVFEPGYSEGRDGC